MAQYRHYAFDITVIDCVTYPGYTVVNFQLTQKSALYFASLRKGGVGAFNALQAVHPHAIGNIPLSKLIRSSFDSGVDYTASMLPPGAYTLAFVTSAVALDSNGVVLYFITEDNG